MTRVARRGPPLAAVLLATLALAGSQARPSAAAWWADMPRLPGASNVAEAPRWYDAFDVAAGLSAATNPRSVAADLMVRARLDAPAYLARVASERDDLDLLDAVVAREGAMREQLAWIARRCDGAWRAWQVLLIDAALENAPDSAADTAYLAALRPIVALDASQPATPLDATVCRLDGVIIALALAHDHPTLVLDTTSRSLRARTEAVMEAPAPATAWIAIDLEARANGQRADVRVGIDLPMPVRVGTLDVDVSGDARGARGRVAWHRSGVAANAAPRRRGGMLAEPSHDDTEEQLEESLLRRRLEAELMRRDADRLWSSTCGSATPDDVVACVTIAADPRSHHGEPGVLDAVLRAIDAEMRALQAVLGAIEASGHALETLLHDR